MHLQLSPIHYYKLMGIINAIRNEWRLIIKQRQQHIYSPSNETIQINIDGINVDLLKITSKMIYNELKRKKQTMPSTQIKPNQKFPELSVEWEKIYSLSFTVTNDTKIREFHYKLLNNIVFSNGRKDSRVTITLNKETTVFNLQNMFRHPHVIFSYK